MEREKPVHWLDVGELIRSAQRASLSKTIGDYVDRREVFAALDRSATPSTPPKAGVVVGDAVWIDYVADVGDGYTATRAVAVSQAATQLDFNLEKTLPGSILIFGGDQVYPTPTVDCYRRRFLGPYQDDVLGDRSVFAIPGNHDWYDGLSSFYKIFCVVDGSRTELTLLGATQARSYWCFNVPDVPWAAIGLDFALNGTLDAPQRRYFNEWKAGVDSLDHDVGLIVCTAQPFWEKHNGLMAEEVARLLPKRARTVLFLSGDKHYLAAWAPHELRVDAKAQQPATPRTIDWEATDRRQAYITAGGGGAYLSLTGFIEDTVHPVVHESSGGSGEYAKVAEWPFGRSIRASAGVARLFRRGTFVLLMAVAYALLGTVSRLAVDEAATFSKLQGDIEETLGDVATPEPTPAGLIDVIFFTARDGSWQTFDRLFRESIANTTWWIAFFVLWGAMAGLAAKGIPRWVKRPRSARWKSKTIKWTFALTIGAVHAAAHFVGALVVTTGAMEFATSELAANTSQVGAYILSLVFWGGVTGTTIFALYLAIGSLVNLNLNEASTAICSENWKNFVRLRCSREGVDVYLYGIQNVRAIQEEDPTAELLYHLHVPLEHCQQPHLEEPTVNALSQQASTG